MFLLHMDFLSAAESGTSAVVNTVIREVETSCVITPVHISYQSSNKIVARRHSLM
jgi:hypothetical protein